MAIGSVATTSPDFYLSTLQKYGLEPTAPAATSASTDPMATGDAATTDAYAPSALVTQALASAYATLANADTSLFTATSFISASTDSGNAANSFVVAIGSNATRALAAYTNAQNGIPEGRTATQLANTELAAAQQTGNPSDANNEASMVQSAIQAAQASVFTSTLNLFA